MVRYIIILLLLGVVNANAQTFKGSEVFTWLGDDVNGYVERPFRILESAEIDERTQLPVMVIQVPLSGFVNIDSLKVNYSLETAIIKDKLQLDFLSNISPSELQFIDKRIVCIRRAYFLQLQLLPVIYDDLEKQFHRVDAIKYEIDIPKILHQKTTLKSTNETKSNSVLAAGKWVKIKVSESGVHKIPYSSLSSWGFSNPQNVNVFGNGGNMLPRDNSEFRHEDLVENAIVHDNDAIYFYAQGPVAWKYNEQHEMFEHQLHDYTEEAYYFLSDNNGDGKRVQESDLISSTYTHETNEFDSYQFHELENQNLLKSGSEWYGLRYDPSQTRRYSFDFKYLVKDEDVKLLTHLIARSNIVSEFNTYVDGVQIQNIRIPRVDYNNYVGAFANEGINYTTFSSFGNTIHIDLTYESSSGSASGWLNYLCLNAKEFIAIDKQLQFRNAEISGEGNSTRFYLQGVTSSCVLWDVSDHNMPRSIPINDYSGDKGFTYRTEELREFVAFDMAAGLPQPEFEETMENQDIRGLSVPEMLIVVHPLFENEARRLASIHQQHSGLQCEIVFPYQIYNEFSSGSPDISAIRDYARYLYEQDDRFKCMLLFGDGSYDNRTNSDNNTNFILTYQSDNSINIKNSFVSDDYYGFLDANEGSNILYDKLDIGIGRFPVSDIDQAKIMVDKVEKYLNESALGAWKTDITFLADDGDNNLHMSQADQLSKQVYGDFQSFNHNKIYFDAYPKTTTSSGDRYPGVNEAIKTTLSNGTLLFNYTGHGSERQLAHENVLDKTTIQQLTNIDRLPVFVTATCEFSRYDDFHDISAGEWVVLSQLGGGVALFTTTRIAWSHENFQINKSFYKNIFREDDNGVKIRLGEVIRDTKNAIGNSVNKLNFTLLGDPSLHLMYPSGDITTNSINGEEDPDLRAEMKALTIADVEGKIMSPTTGKSVVTMQVYDKPITVKTLGNKGAVPFEYQVYQNRIYQGQMNADSDHFLASFRIPKDIRYNIGEGRISYYAYDEDGVESFGADNSVLIGGVSDNPPNDADGPNIKMWLNDESFMNGDLTGSQPILYAKLDDESGINISGVGIGHDITLVLDNIRSLPINLNAYFTSDIDSYTSGNLAYQLPQLEEGVHTLELKVWDNLNNSSVSTLDFEVNLNGTMQITETNVYPNPIETNNTVKISFVHDAPNQLLDVTYSIYSLSGRLIERYNTTQAAVGTTITPIEWTPSAAMQKGLYILRCEIRSAENQVGKFSKKIMVIR
ncbi:type IX secretion system sortase PorU [Carboxylicivirga marina]|uniref:Type IX secretion system sortase PorU n=1 Tax=Carboxylicivirga marina TaxID=2800988 RepID=A0ABS1HL67_9BACT|nr:type IX secretion system sortase PorU [Carboxylicivirga marina]MBK3518417.1 type IX secretion system sortase PorU [Carboxylicivirga marina]